LEHILVANICIIALEAMTLKKKKEEEIRAIKNEIAPFLKRLLIKMAFIIIIVVCPIFFIVVKILSWEDFFHDMAIILLATITVLLINYHFNISDIEDIGIRRDEIKMIDIQGRLFALLDANEKALYTRLDETGKKIFLQYGYLSRKAFLAMQKREEYIDGLIREAKKGRFY